MSRTGRLNQSREAKFPGTNGDKGNKNFPCSADHEQDWQSYLVDPYSFAESADHAIHTSRLSEKNIGVHFGILVSNLTIYLSWSRPFPLAVYS